MLDALARPNFYAYSVFLMLMLFGCLGLPDGVEAPNQDGGTVIVEDARVTDAGRLSQPALDAEVPLDMELALDIGLRDAAMPVDAAVLSDAAVLVDAAVDMVVNTCGDGVVDDGEECDESIATPTCTDQCLRIECGNGRVDPGEWCDDGNANNDDGCIEDCQVYFPQQWAPTIVDPALELSLIHI